MIMDGLIYGISYLLIISKVLPAKIQLFPNITKRFRKKILQQVNLLKSRTL